MDPSIESELDLGKGSRLWVCHLYSFLRGHGLMMFVSVNLGGLFVLEPFISPALYQKYYPDATDEWSLSTLMAADTASGGLSQLEDHYKTFIVSEISSIMGTTLNFATDREGYCGNRGCGVELG